MKIITVKKVSKTKGLTVMNKTKEIDGKLYIYCDETDEWLPKFKTENGVNWELDEKYLIYVLEGDSVDASREREARLDEMEPYNLSPYYGLARKRYIEENSPITAVMMKFRGTFDKHLIEVDKAAMAMEERLIEQYMKAEGVTDELKKHNQMEWVGMVNNITHRVRQIVQNDLIFTDISEAN